MSNPSSESVLHIKPFCMAESPRIATGYPHSLHIDFNHAEPDEYKHIFTISVGLTTSPRSL